MGQEVLHNNNLVDACVKAWPSLPFMAFGLWTGWSFLAYSGSVWLSDSEVNGYHLSVLFVVSTLAFAVVFLAAGIRSLKRKESSAPTDRQVMAAGILTGLGALLIVLVGPYWLGRIIHLDQLFLLGAAMTGVGTSVVGLRCAMLFGGLPPRRALVYAALSQLIAGFVYFSYLACPDWAPISHGPSLAGILLFCLLPVAAAALSCVKPGPESHYDAQVKTYVADSRALSSSFWRFAVFAFCLSLVTTLIRSSVVTTHALAGTVEGNNFIQLLRVVMSVVVVLWAVRSTAQGMDIGRICSLVAVAAAVLVACAAALGGLNSHISVFTYFCSSVFEFLMWCLLAFVTCQKHASPIVVFGLGRGAFMLGCAFGWCLGLVVVPAIPAGSETLMCLVLAGVTLLLWIGLFQEKDYDRLFSPAGEDEVSLEDLFEPAFVDTSAQTDPAEPGGAKKHGRFSSAIAQVASDYSLSAREEDVVRYLAMGYGSDRIADTMGVAVNTVRTHTHNVYVKLDVHSREELMRLVDDAVSNIALA